MSRRESDAKVYVGDLPSNASDKELDRVFREYGKLRSVWVARNPPGFAFVEFENPRDASDAINELDGTVICGVRARVEMCNGRSRPKPWAKGGRPGGRDRGGPPRGGRDDTCYECGERGHFSYDCKRKRDRERRRDNGRRDNFRGPPRGRSPASRSRSRSRS